MGAANAVKDDVYTLTREVVNFFHEVLTLVVNWDTAQLGNGGRTSRGTGAVHLQPRQSPKLQECRAYAACRAVNQRALARSDLSGTIQHLVRRDVVQHEADSLGGVQPGWHGNQFASRQADEPRIGAADWHRGNDLAWLDSRDTVAEPIHHANQIPSWCEGYQRRLGMNALPGHQVRQGDTCSHHSDPHFTSLRLWALLFNHPQGVWSAVAGDDDSRVFHDGALAGLGPDYVGSMSRRL